MSVCCCGGDASSTKAPSNNSNTAPNSQSMNDRGGTKEDDTKAVAWWRQRDGPLSEKTNNLQSGQPSSDLQKPYQMGRDMTPVTPQDGDILSQSHQNQPKKSNKNTPQTQNNMEVFHPQLHDPSSNGGMSSLGQQSEQLRVVSKPTLSSPDNHTAHEDENINKKGKLSFSMDDVKPTTRSYSTSTKKQLAPGFRIPRSKTGVPDHLSDVGSDVDSVTKERYILACQMLKATLIEKKTHLIPMEREYILSLLGDENQNDINNLGADDDDDDNYASSVISMDRVSAIESVTQTLKEDPLFQQEEVGLEVEAAPTPRTAAAIASTAEAPELNERIEVSARPRATDDTKKPKNRKIPKALTRACNPNDLKDLDMEDEPEPVLIVAEEGNISDGEGPFKSQAATTRSLPTASHDDGSDEDGWKAHRPDQNLPVQILGIEDVRVEPRVLTLSMMEALRGFLPFKISQSNYWLKFSLSRDGHSLSTLMNSIRATTYTIIAVETDKGDIFGSFCGSRWCPGKQWYGSGEAFLWRNKHSRLPSPGDSKGKSEMEVYPFSGFDQLVQYCTARTIAIGGGDWINVDSPYSEPSGIGLMIDGDLAGGETNSCATFANPRLSKHASSISNEFRIRNLEVWSLTKSASEADAEKQELHEFFVEQTSRDTRRQEV